MKAKRMNQLARWAERHVFTPARRIFENAATEVEEMCDGCWGSGWDWLFKERCTECHGEGYRLVLLSPAGRRRMIDDQLRAAGLNPTAFDHKGRLVRA